MSRFGPESISYTEGFWSCQCLSGTLRRSTMGSCAAGRRCTASFAASPLQECTAPAPSWPLSRPANRRQNPTIIVESPLAPSSSPPPRTPVKEEEERKKGQQTRNEELANPYPQPLLRDKPLQGSTQSLSSTEHDTYL
ncbi:hypothetical protein SKAU_G00279540 [Synaphobranchus kaupii]|uniref:Uncharacterized protein n=1 Tax=Synaphobranchus kaupii TaxID=118154 RepID=A0A9Q1INW1_SYNKA|nr:hypothetical protein SKAU_G00279540 [Synaphobranchus kaupii]